MVYAPVSMPFTVRTEALTADKLKAWWFNPRTGEATPIGDFANDKPRTFTLGGSVGVLIPKTVAREMSLSEGTTLELTNSADHLVMRKRSRRRARRPIADIVAQINPAAYRRHTRELAADPPRGKELW